MRTSLRLAFILMMLSYSAVWCVARFQSSNETRPLDRVVSGFEMREASMEEAVARLLVANHLSGGMVFSFKCDSGGDAIEAKRVFSFSGIPLREALNQILSNDRNYRWTSEGNAVVVSPASGMPDLLKTKIDHFEVNNSKYTLSAATGDLLQLPEIKRRKAELDLKQGTQYMIGGSNSRELLSGNISVSNITMYEALNAIAQANGFAVWRYSEHRCGKTNELSITWIVPNP